MLVKEKFYKSRLNYTLYYLIILFIVNFFLLNHSHADLKKNLISKLVSTNTLSFNFKQIIGENEENGHCFIKYPLLMKCDYKDLKNKILISNGKTVAIIKKKYKKIYYYPIKKTPLYTILKKENIFNLIENNEPYEINSNLIQFELTDKRSNKLKIFFNKNSLQLQGWETIDAYSNNVSFFISNVEINNIINDDVFKIPKEKDL